MKLALHKFFATALVFLAIFSQANAAVETWPQQPVRIIVPIDAGTLQDLMARKLAAELSTIWQQPVIVVNQPGASGVIGTQSVAKSAPDGHTIGLVSATFTGVQAIRSDIPFSRQDLRGVTKFALQTFMIFAHSQAPFNTMQEMITYAKANPGKLDYATPGVGSLVHVTMEHLSLARNLATTHIPYQKMSQAAQDVASGRVHLLITVANPTLKNMVSDGQLKIIGSLSDPARYQGRQVPSISTVVPDVRANGYYGMVVAANTPPDVINKIHKDVLATMATTDIQQFMSTHDIQQAMLGGQNFDTWIDIEIDRLRQIAKQAKIKIN